MTDSDEMENRKVENRKVGGAKKGFHVSQLPRGWFVAHTRPWGTPRNALRIRVLYCLRCHGVRGVGEMGISQKATYVSLRK